MTVESMEPNKIKMILSGKDMENIGISYEALDYKEEETKQVIGSLLETAKREVGFDSTGFRLFVEVFKATDGGCVFFFTRVEKNSTAKAASKIQVRRQSILPVTLYFELLDDLCAFCRSLLNNRKLSPLSSSLYRYGDSYCLILYIFHTHYKPLSFLMGEYSSRVLYGHTACAHTEEFGEALLLDGATEQLAKI